MFWLGFGQEDVRCNTTHDDDDDDDVDDDGDVGGDTVYVFIKMLLRSVHCLCPGSPCMYSILLSWSISSLAVYFIHCSFCLSALLS